MSEKLCALRKIGGGTLRETDLWTNSSPTSTFTPQSVTLSDSVTNYDYIRFYCRGSTSNSIETSVMISVSDFINTLGINVFKPSIDFSISSGRFDRSFTCINDNTVEIADAYQVNNGANNNTLLIPLRITGCKL